MPNGKAENETKEALHTAGCSLIESTFHIVKTEDKEIVLDNIPEVIGKLERIRLTEVHLSALIWDIMRMTAIRSGDPPFLVSCWMAL